MPRIRLQPRDWLAAGATMFCGGLSLVMGLLIRSDVRENEQQIRNTHIDVTMAKTDIQDIKSDLTIIKSDVTNVRSDLVTTRNALTNQILLNWRMAGRSPFSFHPDPGRAGAAGSNMDTSTDWIMSGKGCS